ncbi:uncharacterized protein EV420DRAFT_1474699 [Desarmillaria tabescens]|uniref:Uncharacterized protein n=1 Tax=Armillaria tabescens TaxID=1929756 RepID=A0AA39NHZ4_ARMTA|nr:uncharacterized protein EV420DRAFT_1474699 [Desarmillaria tabescens]KAK0465874.1 hypothetical protein EV420DRAFT_1474699 [Desarmillaria tabescens]
MSVNILSTQSGVTASGGNVTVNISGLSPGEYTVILKIAVLAQPSENIVTLTCSNTSTTATDLEDDKSPGHSIDDSESQTCDPYYTKWIKNPGDWNRTCEVRLVGTLVRQWTGKFKWPTPSYSGFCCDFLEVQHDRFGVEDDDLIPDLQDDFLTLNQGVLEAQAKYAEAQALQRAKMVQLTDIAKAKAQVTNDSAATANSATSVKWLLLALLNMDAVLVALTLQVEMVNLQFSF